MLTVSTASPYKFAKDVYVAVSGKEPTGDVEALTELAELTGTSIPTPLAKVLEKSVRHTRTISKEDMEDATICFAKIKIREA